MPHHLSQPALLNGRIVKKNGILFVLYRYDSTQFARDKSLPFSRGTYIVGSGINEGEITVPTIDVYRRT